MSSVVEAARNLMAVMSPLTGTRASGVSTVTASGADVDLYEGNYAIPRLGNNYRDDLVVKVGPGPNTATTGRGAGRTYWTVTSSGTDVTFLSNLGGARHNKIEVPASGQTDIVFDPPISGIASSVLKTSFTGGADPAATDLDAVYDMFMYEQFKGDPRDLAKSNMNRLPGVLVVWRGSEQADGASVSHEDRTRLGNFQTLNREAFDILVFVKRSEGDHVRRMQGQYIMDQITGYLTDRVDYDGQLVSAPSGVQIQRRFPLALQDPKGYTSVYIYGLGVSVMTTFTMTDERTYNDLDLFIFDIVKPFTAAEGGDIAVVGDGSPGAPGVNIDNT